MASNEGVELPDPGDADAPKYWMRETGGELKRAIERYLRSLPITDQQIALIRAYFRQWIVSPVWDRNPHASASATAALAKLRESVDAITTREAIAVWLTIAEYEGMDPL